MINGDLQSLASNLSQTSLDKNGDKTNYHYHHHNSINRNSNSTLHHIPNQIYLQIGFIMDGVVSMLELDTYYPYIDSRMLYVADPTIYSLNNGHGKSIIVGRPGEDILPFKGDVLVIEGENLAVLLLSEYELNITIGTQRCNITSVNMRQIICQPPAFPPGSTDELGRRNPINLPAVVLKIGNMRRYLGYLHYGDYFYEYNSLDGVGGVGPYGNDDSSRFYHQNHSPFGYGNRFESVTSINVELLIVVSILIGTILTIISVIILAAYKHKTTEAEREYKRIQLQMDTLENNVRSECKQAFAELQTDILQASGLFSLDEFRRGMNLPTHDERTFLLRMFIMNEMFSGQRKEDGKDNVPFDGSVNRLNWNQQLLKAANLYPIFWYYSPYFAITDADQLPSFINRKTIQNINVLGTNDNNNGSVVSGTGVPITFTPNTVNTNGVSENFYTLNRHGLNSPFTLSNRNPIISQQQSGGVIEQFEQLLLNQSFLLILINTLEQQQKTFSITERIRFASLLMITLLDRMEYAFDVMRHLLTSLIDRYASTKHSAQLIRNNETIVENMLIDWLSICLYKYAREVSSGPLFLLFSALKHQIDKGPVDYVTGNSR